MLIKYYDMTRKIWNKKTITIFQWLQVFHFFFPFQVHLISIYLLLVVRELKSEYSND